MSRSSAVQQRSRRGPKLQKWHRRRTKKSRGNGSEEVMSYPQRISPPKRGNLPRKSHQQCLQKKLQKERRGCLAAANTYGGGNLDNGWLYCLWFSQVFQLSLALLFQVLEPLLIICLKEYYYCIIILNK